MRRPPNAVEAAAPAMRVSCFSQAMKVLVYKDCTDTNVHGIKERQRPHHALLLHTQKCMSVVATSA